MNTKTGVSIKTDRKTTDHEYRLPPDYMTREEHNEDVSEAAEQIKNQIPQGFSGSWEDLSDKPFYNEYINTITWDGNTSGLYSIPDGYKVSDGTCKMSDLVDVSFTDSGGTVTKNPSIKEYDNYIKIGSNAVMIVKKQYTINSGTKTVLPGIYFHARIRSITIGGKGFAIYTKTLDSVFIDKTIPRIPTASVGNVIRVKAIDANGVPTEWESVSLANNTHMLYIDVDNKIRHSSITGPLVTFNEIAELIKTMHIILKDHNDVIHNITLVSPFLSSGVLTGYDIRWMNTMDSVDHTIIYK